MPAGIFWLQIEAHLKPSLETVFSIHLQEQKKSVCEALQYMYCMYVHVYELRTYIIELHVMYSLYV